MVLPLAALAMLAVLRARIRVLVIAMLALAVGTSVAVTARADDSLTLAGRWSASPLTVRWIIGEWGAACGPRPSGGGENAGLVVITQQGAELTISGGGRTYTTTSCWEQYPGIGRIGHAVSARSYKTTCRTPPADPRQASLVTTLTATDTSISFYEAGQYQFVIQEQNCTASVGRYRTYSLLERAGTAPPPSSAAPSASAVTDLKKPEPVSNRCANPGAPARLEVRPARKLVRAGDQYTFRAIVSDAAGCVVYQRPTWAFESGGDQADLAGQGTIAVHPNAPEGELKLTASIGGRSAVVTIEIATAARYDKLLQSGAFNAQGEVDEAATVAIASQAIGATSAVAEDRASGRKWMFVGLVGVVAVMLALAGLLVFSRSRKARAAETAKDAARRTQASAQPPVPVAPPPVVPSPESVAPVTPRVPRTICPICGQQYPSESRYCGKDGATLLPLN
ncbi:MAG TPA: hypothetical protein VH062_18170 [Polyangiaceae bacterium]|nr:hypothetical protein [Polyangiaceae bacterium]